MSHEIRIGKRGGICAGSRSQRVGVARANGFPTLSRGSFPDKGGDGGKGAGTKGGREMLGHEVAAGQQKLCSSKRPPHPHPSPTRRMSPEPRMARVHLMSHYLVMGGN